jgi:hypothetical protein
MFSTNSKSPKRDTRIREKTNKKNNLQLLFFANRVSQFIFVNFSFALFTPPSRRLSAAVVVERREEGHALLIQRPVYFISEVLSETKICYPQIQKLLYTVILTRRKL